MEAFNRQTLQQLTGEAVTLRDSAGTEVQLTIHKVEAGVLDGEQWESFSLLLHGTPDFHVPQGSYHLQHERFGEQFLFLSPGSPVEYEIVVNTRKS